jgi:hypothetical protein
MRTMSLRDFQQRGVASLPPPWFKPLLEEAHFQPVDPAPWPYPGPDPDDLIFLALARHTGAVLVSGNLADYPRDIRGGVQVMSAREFLEQG